MLEDVRVSPVLGQRYPLVTAAAPWLLAVVLWGFFIKLCFFVDFGTDTHAYWLAGQATDLYNQAPATKDAYLYAPVFAQVISPLTGLSFWVFYGLWIGAEAAVLIWLVKPLRMPWRLCVIALCMPELIIGNIYIFMAGAIVLGLTRPAFWSFLVLTKVTPGVGVLYFAAARQWRQVAVAMAATILISALSFVVAPRHWVEWVTFMTTHGEGKPWLFAQLGCAVLVAVAAGRTGKTWLVPVAVLISFPVLNTPAAPAVLAAIPRLLSHGKDAVPDGDQAAPSRASVDA